MLNWTTEKMKDGNSMVLLDDTWKRDADVAGGLTANEIVKLGDARPVRTVPKISLRYIETAPVIKASPVPRVAQSLARGDHKGRFSPEVVLNGLDRWRFNEHCYLTAGPATSLVRLSALFYVIDDSNPYGEPIAEDAKISCAVYKENALAGFEQHARECFGRAIDRAKDATVLPQYKFAARVARIAVAFSEQIEAYRKLTRATCIALDEIAHERSLTGDDGA